MQSKRLYRIGRRPQDIIFSAIAVKIGDPKGTVCCNALRGAKTDGRSSAAIFDG